MTDEASHYSLGVFSRKRTLHNTPTYNTPTYNTPTYNTFDTCTHERRPGTTVCLRCRHAARVAARARTNRLVLRGSAITIVVATFVAVGVVGASTFRQLASGTKSDSAPAALADSSAIAGAPKPQVDSTATTTVPSPVTAAELPQTTPPAPAPVAPPAAPFAPAIPRGETMLADSAIAVRSDSEVVVSFDRTPLRTRRPEKFEQFVRTTLESVYGAPAAAIIRRLPVGAIAAQGDLVKELPARGVRIPVDAAWVIRLFPETRPGQDGPLVIRYRVRLVPVSN